MNTVEFVSIIPRCPKLHHIKPCWCQGVARCLGVKKNSEQCVRIVTGDNVLCWQHRKWVAAVKGET